MREETHDERARAQSEGRAIAREHEEVRDSGEEASIEARRDRDVALDAEAQRRLGDIERALKKIEAGNYGVSDESGESIPQERLEAVPWARFTLEEERSREKAQP